MEPTFELQKAVIDRLKADAGVAAIAGARVFDRVPDGEDVFPYIAMGPSDAVTDDADCLDGMEITLQIDCYSSGGGEAFSSAEVRKLSGAVRSALHEAEIVLVDNALALMRHRITRFTREQDNTVNRAIVSITALVEIT